jgi:branched-chain amino acid transport system substrate-binding protein
MKHLSEKFGFNKYFLIAQDTETGKAIHGLMTNLLKGAGWEQVGYEAIPLGTTDFSITVQKVKNSGAQVMLMFYDPSEIAILVDQWATMKVPAICLGLAGPMLDRTLWKSYGGKVESVALHVCEAGVFPVPSIPRSVEFFNNYSKRFGHAPEGVGGQAPSYDSVYVLKAAIEKAGSLDPDAIVEAIRNVDMPGAIGRIRFDKTNQVVFGNDGKETAVGLFVQWQAGGKLAAVFPLANAETATQLPPWMKK